MLAIGEWLGQNSDDWDILVYKISSELLQEGRLMYTQAIIDYKAYIHGGEQPLDYNENNIWIDPIDTLQTLYNEWYDEEFEYVIGDINQDYIVNILDVVLIVNFIMTQNISGIQFYLSDINEDPSFLNKCNKMFKLI